jgi:hypothetical protein
MNAAGEWPLPLRRRELDQESSAYKRAVATVTDKCRKGTPIQFEEYVALRNTVDALRKKVMDVVPTSDKMQSTALEFVRGLDEASRLFADQAYAEQLIRDVSEHKAATVGELLAFMRQYRLLFADAGKSPAVAQLYGTLYGLMREQRERLRPVLAAAPPETAKEQPPPSAKIPARALKLIEQARSTLGELKYPRAAKYRERKNAAVAELDKALSDAAEGVVPLERLKKAQKEVKGLRSETTKKAEHVRLLKQAAAQLDEALENLERAPRQ